MKKKIIVLCGVLIFALLGFIGTTVAWLTSTGTKETTVTVGEVSYTITGDFVATGIVVPGQPLLSSTVTLTNNSTVKSQLRVLIDVKTEATENKLTEKHLLLETTGNWGTPVDATIDSEAVQYYYYKGEEGIIDAGAVIDSFLSSLKFDGTKVGNAHAGQEVTITITFQAKQAEYVSWNDLTSYSFKTGLAS